MSFWEFVTRVGVPLIVVVGAAVIAVGAYTDSPDTFSWPRGWQWAWVGLWVMASGEAAFGTERPFIERAWRGAAALLVAVACVVAVWRHQRWRRRVQRTDGDAAR
ncbi:hypothetical protein ACLQ24_03195 [Micromonospora sp. DT4]|uniref:hypothetical protein n=1 Tax=Micromonospora sp. DT4 TaxID=3393438 RepID=UPI003CF0E536